MQLQNIFKNIPPEFSGERTDVISESEHVRIERIVSRGHASPEDFWYDQAEKEYVLLLQGMAALKFEDEKEPVVMKPGDHVVIPAHVKHRVEWTDPEQDTIWLAVFHPA
jgi:cupin 2 domain-containing protein